MQYKQKSIKFEWVGPTNLYPGQVQAPWEYYLNLAQMVATRSKCLHRKVGAVIIKDKRIVATGYNGTPTGLKECTECHRTPGDPHYQCNAIHAEENAILQTSMYGPSTINSKMYCTIQPCFHCAKLIIQCGICEVSYIDSYPDTRGIDLLESSGVTTFQHKIR